MKKSQIVIWGILICLVLVHYFYTPDGPEIDRAPQSWKVPQSGSLSSGKPRQPGSSYPSETGIPAQSIAAPCSM